MPARTWARSASKLLNFTIQIVGLPDKAVAESRERVQAALHASGLSMPAKKVTVNCPPTPRPWCD